MYYILEHFADPHWIATGFILEGEYRTHLMLLDTIRTKDNIDVRARRIGMKDAHILIKNGMRLFNAPTEKKTDV